MKIVGPERYDLSYTPESFSVSERFSGIAKSSIPKLYIASIDGRPIYVGITKQGMQKRLAYGWKAAGRSGYYGYAWRRQGVAAVLDVWGHVDAVDRNVREIETVEAEVVYLVRLITGEWPGFQTEIHFYPSTNKHRRIAETIIGHYGLKPPQISPV
ncbi:MAG: hypothetical protein E5V60_01540 [Mesorhizobium sp.]|uniref:hypothetical protein n=1 Tax=Mesorhizobium sp. TaxID=1871066 RepID=UPI000FE5D360|nr:hypothetical protein [Mesorhizobium sp.]RWP57495.1 MAG: hypothetical protein EOR08_30470 [Mesorhizobium sp.]TIW69250.1 MAG: hypothetical protein E5V60_01540 [Mesorhizobium sp.]